MLSNPVFLDGWIRFFLGWNPVFLTVRPISTKIRTHGLLLESGWYDGAWFRTKAAASLETAGIWNKLFHLYMGVKCHTERRHSTYLFKIRIFFLEKKDCKCCFYALLHLSLRFKTVTFIIPIIYFSRIIFLGKDVMLEKS